MNRAERRRHLRQQKKSGSALPPADIQRLYREAATHLLEGQLTEAEHHYRKLLAANPRDADALNMLGIIAGQQGDHATARGLLTKAIRINPNKPVYQNNLGLALREAGKPEDAIQAFRKAIDLDPSLSQAHNNLGNTLKRLGDMDAAIEAYQRALELEPDDNDTLHNLGGACLNKGLIKEALKSYGKALLISIRGPHPASRPSCRPLPFNKQKAREALLDFRKILGDRGIEFFLRSGTLLGCIREGDFLEHDKDIDIGILSNIDKDSVVRLLEKTSEFEPLADPYGQQNNLSFTALHTNGTPFDIYFYQDRGDHYIAGCYLPGKPITKTFTKFGVKPVKFAGTSFLAPDNFDLYLTELYGDWKVPKPSFDSMVSSRNLDVGTEDISKCFAYGRIGDALQNKDHERAAAYCEQLLERFPEDDTARKVLAYLRIP